MTRLAVLLGLAALFLTAATASAAGTRLCPQSDPDNGIRRVRVAEISCASGFAVAKQTNSVRCFLNGDSCRHRFRGRTWACRLSDSLVRCRSGQRVVTYRLG